jgi:hypothetical protein
MDGRLADRTPMVCPALAHGYAHADMSIGGTRRNAATSPREGKGWGMGIRERLVASVTDIRARGQRLVQLNLELLTSELKEKGRQFGAAIGLFVGAALLALYGIGFALATLAVVLALVLPLWLSLLIVTALLFLTVAIMVLVGRSKVQQAQKPPAEAALAEARTTAGLIKANVRETAAGARATLAPKRKTASAGTASPAAAPPLERPGQGDQPSETPLDAGARDS